VLVYKMACTYYSLLTVDMSSHGNPHQNKVEQRNGDCWFTADVTAADNTTEETAEAIKVLVTAEECVIVLQTAGTILIAIILATIPIAIVPATGAALGVIPLLIILAVTVTSVAHPTSHLASVIVISLRFAKTSTLTAMKTHLPRQQEAQLLE
jgi:hypothetical protein